MKKRHVIGLDFGTLSVRCLIVDPENGKKLAEAVSDYPHGILEKELPTGEKIPENFALQHPEDYLFSMKEVIGNALRKSGCGAETICGIGLDFTSCTLLPVDKDLVPLCLKKDFAGEPHAWVKLWKHHGAAEEAEEITELARKRKEPWLSLCGGTMSAEYGLPKILETLRKAPEVYRNAARFMEAGDWIASLLTGKEVHSASMAGYKFQWNGKEGFFSPRFLEELDPGLKDLAGTKLSSELLPLNCRELKLDGKGAFLTGLLPGTSVSVPVIDAHAGMPGCGTVKEGELMMVLGTSACHLVHCRKNRTVPGIFGCVEDGVIPGVCTCEAGQSAVGDLLEWFVTENVPAYIYREAEKEKKSVHELLSEKAALKKAGESGLMALDWVGGNRTPLNDASLTGVMTGLKLSTAPEDKYRAWIESLAYGTRMILENYEKNGIRVDRVLVSGGIAHKNPFMMQVYADVTGKKLEVVETDQAAALGSAVYAAAAAGIYPDIRSAVEKMHSPVEKTYEPDEDNQKTYDVLYLKYRKLFEVFKEKII